jgi:hypothetical protein
MAEGFYAMNRTIRNAKADSAAPDKTTKKLAISESCKSTMSFCAPPSETLVFVIAPHRFEI